eukprot:1187709-Ditylum_brightwellii.AAC.1
MPQSATDLLPSFFQVGKLARERVIQAMCIPSLSSIAAAYGRKLVHYLAATVENLGGKAYLDRVLTLEAAVKIAQYKYDSATHEVKPIDMQLPDNNDEGNGLAGWEHMENSFAS